MSLATRLKVFYSDTFVLPLPARHRFPLDKYRLLRERLQQSPLADRLDLKLAPAATDEQLLRVHTRDYLEKLKVGGLSTIEQRRIGFPWSPELVERSRRSTGATCAAASVAITDGAAVHLAGGTHHAFAGRGQGFCVFNDVAVAVRSLQAAGAIGRALIVDLDVHQGNGTAAIFAGDPSVFTFSVHGARNFPFSKCDGDLDIAVPDGTLDDTYLSLLSDALAKMPLREFDLVFYLAGADAYEHDRYGRLKLTKSGLARRDELVADACQCSQLPIAIVLAGGYAKKIEDVVDIHFATVSRFANGPAQFVMGPFGKG